MVSKFESFLKEETLSWLLESANPSSRYLTLTQILGEENTDVKKARSLINDYPLIIKILSMQKEEGYWEDAHSPYLPKYKSTYWQIMIFSQLGLSIENDKVRKACEFIFRFQHEDGGFTVFKEEGATKEYLWKKRSWEVKEEKIPTFDEWALQVIRENEMTCLTGNLVESLLRLGYKADERIKKAIDWLIKVQNADGGWLCPYWHAHIHDKHSCFMGAIAPLHALSEVPESERTEEMKKCIQRGTEFFLIHHLYKADHHNYRVIKPEWLDFNFPIFWYDILRGLLVITELGYSRDERIQDALSVLLKKQTEDGKWNLEKTPSGRMHASFGKAAEPNKWVTINALKVLKNIYA
jgi:hypothetical protein